MVNITENAIIKRVNRKLAFDGLKLRKTRGNRWRNDLGDYYTIRISSNSIEGCHHDLEVYARSLEVLRHGEVIV